MPAPPPCRAVYRSAGQYGRGGQFVWWLQKCSEAWGLFSRACGVSRGRRDITLHLSQRLLTA